MTESFSANQYSAIRGGSAGLIDLSSRGRILVSGSEAVMFLNGLITNDMKTLAVDSWMPAAFANVQGRLLAVVRMIHREDGFLIDTESETQETVLKLLDRFTVAGDFRVGDLTQQLTALSIQGRQAGKVVCTALGEGFASLERQKVASAKSRTGGKITVIRATHTAEDGFDLFVDGQDAMAVHGELIAAGAVTVGENTVETLRVEAGIPRYGIDMDETTVVTEANLDDAVSFTKGCYIGQEIIVRIKHRGHVAKKLTGVIVDGSAELERDAKILSANDREIGRVTSSTFSPRLGRTVALAYLKYDYLGPATPVKVIAGDHECAGAVADLPFVRGSWYENSV